MKTLIAVYAAVFYCAAAFGWSVDSVTVDSVWNSDSSWYDNDGILQQRSARDCFVGFIPRGTGAVSCSLAISLDSGKSWGVTPNPLRILDSNQNGTYQCGIKGRIKARVFGADRPGVVFKVVATACIPGTAWMIEGFENGFSQWENLYMVSTMEKYSQMRITTEAAHNGTHSLTTDSNMTALYHVENKRVETGVVGVEFYMKASSPGQANFGVEIGQNPGSSGTVSPAFGIFFDPSDSIKCIFFTNWPANDSQTMIAPIQPDHWYKCRVEVNLNDSTASYYIDDALKHTQNYTSDIGLMGIDRVLVLRGVNGKPPSTSSEGTKPYFVDDILLYTR